MRVLISGGGTGGHVYPALAVFQALQARLDAAPADATSRDQPRAAQSSAAAAPRRAVPPSAADAPPHAAPRRVASWPPPPVSSAAVALYVGSEDGVERDLAMRAGLSYRAIATGQLRGRAPWTAAANLLRMAHGARQSAALLREFQPQVCFVTGGYVCTPVAWAAKRMGVPVLIYLPDLTPGLAIRALSLLAARVAVSFPEVAPWFPGKAVVTGYPLRPELHAAAADRPGARAHFNLAPDLPVLLVFGGSRGARSINQALLAALPALVGQMQVVHISGTLDWPQVEAQAAALPESVRAHYHGFAYLHDDMALALAAADLVVARAGASTLGEFPLLGLPAILAPLPVCRAASGRQRRLPGAARRGRQTG
ncbi:MAG: glycosyltransferase [Anaerolineae bacterium]|nr:glycosyltransferase [Anaerolineae bacterium]